MIFLWYQFGDPLLFGSAQTVFWGRELTNPLITLREAWIDAGDSVPYLLDPANLFLDPRAGPTLEASSAINIAFLALFLVLMVVGFAALPPGLSAYSFVVMALHVLTPSPLIPLLGLPRFMLEAFPLFLVLGLLLSRNRPTLVVWLLVSGGLGAALTTLFVTWRWVA
jgi:hypothetical protein